MAETEIRTRRRAVIYVRQSLDRTKNGAAVDRQLDVLRPLCEARGFDVVATLVDNDLSAHSGRRRPEFERLCAGIARDDFDVVAAWHYDRVTRTLRDHAKVLSAGDHTLIIGPSGDTDLSTPTGRMVAGVQVSVAAYEVEHSGERRTLANQQRAAAGAAPGGRRAFGYDDDGAALREPEATMIRDAYRAVLDGVSISAIARQWEAAGVTPTQPRTLAAPRGPRPWTRNSVRQILLNPRNAGMRAYRGEIQPVVGQWEPIIDESTWRAARAVIEDPARRTSPTTARRWLLTSVATCGLCGGPMKVHWSTPTVGARRRRYLCADNRHVSRGADFVDGIVEGAVIGRLARADARELLVDTDRPDIGALSAERDTLRRRLDDVAVDYADGAVTRSQLTTITERVRAALADVEGRMEHVDRAPLLADLIGADDVAARWATLGLDRQRAVVALLLSVVVDPSPVGRRPLPETVRLEWRA